MKHFYVCAIVSIISFGACGPLRAGPTAYVATNGAHVYPYNTWATAASNLQAAADAVDTGGTVWVTNGVYATGGAEVYGMSNRVALTRAVTLQSVNGPDVTFIRGQGPFGAGAVRCAYLIDGAALVGFTLTNGFTHSSGDRELEQGGGGALLFWGGTVSNCAVNGNSAKTGGGGVYCYFDGTVQACTISGNSVFGYSSGGGVCCLQNGTLRNCTISNNKSGNEGGGVSFLGAGVLQNCTVSGNSAYVGGGVVVRFATMVNTIVFGNTDDFSSNVSYSDAEMSFTNCCTSPAVPGIGNIAADPKFVNAAAGDYRLHADSPCIDTGFNQAWMDGATDLDGKPRILNGTADMGAYEADCVVTITAGPNGTVSPSGSFRMPPGQPLTVTVTPDADCFVADVILDGQSSGPSAAPVLSYSFAAVTNNLTVSATFLPRPDVAYVSTNGSSLCPYDTWDKAAAAIQDAVDYVRSGGAVQVSNGVFAAGGAVVCGMSNRVALTRPVTLQSVNGPDATFICGQGPLGEGAVRCAYVTNGATLAGFTLTNGFTRSAGNDYCMMSGGGVLLDRGGTVSNCAVNGNSAKTGGGGVYCYFDGTVQACTISGNTASYSGGIYCDYGGTVQNCVVSGNTASHSYGCGGGIFCSRGGTVQNCAVRGNSVPCYGGGIYCTSGGTVQNCTVDGNSANSGGGVYCYFGGALTNTIVFANTGGSSSNVYSYGSGISFTACCTAPAVSGDGNIAADPLFVDVAAGDYRLQTNSPCIDAGLNQPWMSGAADLDGKPRILNGTADMGAYEADCVVTVTASPNGTVNPSGSFRAPPGQPLTVTVTPDFDYYVADVLVDGQSLGLSAAPLQHHTFANVTNNHTLSATFLPSPAMTYVSTHGANLYPYDSWEKAASAIQDAVDALRSSGGAVWVTNGVYAAGGAEVWGMSNRVALTRAVTLQSVNGPEVTVIEGQGPLGAGAVRCAYVTNGAALAGFTLTNGCTRSSGDATRELSGGGVWLDRGGTVSNCAVSGNTAAGRGGGVFCYSGGTALNCLIGGNTAGEGGGVYCNGDGALLNGTVAGNTAAALCGGVVCDGGGVLVNTIVFGNIGGGSSNVYAVGSGMGFTNCCADTELEGVGNIAADPLFVAAASGDYRLRVDSPCTDAGLNEAWMDGATDLDGKPRILNGIADMGAYESGFTFTVTAGPNGTVSPSGTVFVSQGQTLTVNVSPDADYYMADFLIDGQSSGPAAAPLLSYTFEDVTNFHTISAIFLAKPDVTYASTNGANLCPYDTWEKASAVIQDAVSAAHSGGTVWASNGVYAAGGSTVYGISNRVALTRPVTLQSVNGPDVTVIEGQGPLGDGAVRCAYVTNGAALAGFTLTQGFTRSSDDIYRGGSGGGAWLDGGGTVSNCAVNGNAAMIFGGGVMCFWGGTVQNCTVDGNAAEEGGGVFCYFGGTVRNCAVGGNTAAGFGGGGIMCYCGGTVLGCGIGDNTASRNGGGVFCYYSGGTVRNCTVGGNTATEEGGGVICYGGGTLVNTIVFANNSDFGSSNICVFGSEAGFTVCCTDTELEGTGNIAANPLFVDTAAGDYRLQTNSPCINAGIYQDWMDGATDLDGKPRVIHGTVDIGAYEAILPGWDEDADGLPDEWEWGQASTLTGLASDADADGDGADNLAEYGADTDPFSGSSLLMLTSIAPEAGGMRVAWRGGRNAWQYLERSTNLSDGAAGWTAVYTNEPPTASAVDVLDLPPAGPAAFYRVRAQR